MLFVTHLVVVVVVVVVVLIGFHKKAKTSVVSNLIGTKFGRNVLNVNPHRLTEPDFQFEVTHVELSSSGIYMGSGVT